MSNSKKKTANIQPKVSIILDQRENNIFLDGFEKKVVQEKMKWTKSTLPVGDIWYKYGDKTLVIIERKTLADLNSSIGDGRYKEQKLRMIDSEIPFKYYLVEGNLYGPYRDLKKVPLGDYSRIYGALVHTTLRDGIPIIRTENMEDTYQTLFKIYYAVDRFGGQILKKFKEKPGAAEYVETLKPAKKDNMTSAVCYLAQLRQIPGVSVQMAQTIADNYSNFQELIAAYNKLDSSDHNDRNKMLSGLVMPNRRKIGPVVSKRVYQYLFGISSDSG